MKNEIWILQVLKKMFEAETPKEAFNILMVNMQYMTHTDMIMALQVVHSKWKAFEDDD
ncbi:MAG: hypothetical protein ACLQVJ_13145 [Syntrophobacteraceae bacterium]